MNRLLNLVLGIALGLSAIQKPFDWTDVVALILCVLNLGIFAVDIIAEAKWKAAK